MESPASLFEYNLGNDVPTLEAMPLLEELVEQNAAAKPLKGVTALLIQHQLGNQGPQLDALMRLGLEPKKTYWLDIPYTSSPEFRRVAQKRHGIPTRNFWVSDYKVLNRYPEFQFRRTQEALLKFLRDPPDKLLVLDDGAYFLEAAMSFRKQLPHVAIVEQTTRGITKIKENPALARYARHYPVVNVARCTPKLELEAPWIGMSVLLSLTKHLRNLATRSRQFEVKRKSPCLVLGYGAIGRQVAAHLDGVTDVRVFDSDSARTELAKRDGFQTWDPVEQIDAPSPTQFKMVVGCTGKASFRVGDQVFLDSHSVLASASSGAVELSRNDFIDWAAASRYDDIRISTRRLVADHIHQSLRMHLVDREVVFLNAGFPINFDGRLNSIPCRYMQPTATLMVHGALQALKATQTGVIDVGADFCRELTNKFHSLLNDQERSILGVHPSNSATLS